MLYRLHNEKSGIDDFQYSFLAIFDENPRFLIKTEVIFGPKFVILMGRCLKMDHFLNAFWKLPDFYWNLLISKNPVMVSADEILRKIWPKFWKKSTFFWQKITKFLISKNRNPDNPTMNFGQNPKSALKSWLSFACTLPTPVKVSRIFKVHGEIWPKMTKKYPFLMQKIGDF